MRSEDIVGVMCCIDGRLSYPRVSKGVSLGRTGRNVSLKGEGAGSTWGLLRRVHCSINFR